MCLNLGFALPGSHCVGGEEFLFRILGLLKMRPKHALRNYYALNRMCIMIAIIS